MGLLFALLLTAATPSVQAYPHFSHAPSDVRVLARMRAQPRDWCLAVSSEDSPYERISCEATENAAESTTVWFRGVPPGHYTATLTVRYLDGAMRVARDTFCVSGFDVTCGGEP